jgi:hypothetical protein
VAKKTYTNRADLDSLRHPEQYQMTAIVPPFYIKRIVSNDRNCAPILYKKRPKLHLPECTPCHMHLADSNITRRAKTRRGSWNIK